MFALNYLGGPVKQNCSVDNWQAGWEVSTFIQQDGAINHSRQANLGKYSDWIRAEVEEM